VARRDLRLVKSVGEHYVCSQLARWGWAASLTRDGLERTDVLAVHVEGEDDQPPPRRTVELQVKTSRVGSNWQLGLKGLQPARTDAEWYVLVDLEGSRDSKPRCYVLPRDHVAAALWITHQSWRFEPGIPEGQRKTGLDRARVSADRFVRYEERWELLAEPAYDVPVLLPKWMQTEIDNPSVGLPEHHRWRTNQPRWVPEGTPA
jgi:hypothetical protein